MKITILTSINSNIETVWDCWTNPEHIINWNFASDEWHCPTATNNLNPGGAFSYRMEAKDGSMGFDFEGVYETILEHELITFSLGDNRIVEITFSNDGNSTTITETFEAEDEHSAQQQKEGWQAILNNFKNYFESK